MNAAENPDLVRFARAMVPIMALPARRAAELVARAENAALEVLDIAAGHGMFGIEVGRRFDRARIFALDWAPVLNVARANADAAGLGALYFAIPGNAFSVPLGGPYDVILVPNFLHHFSANENIAFLRRLRAALQPNGMVVTVEFVPDAERVTPPIPAGFALTMLLLTESGDAYTFDELKDMFRQAGFSRSELHGLAPSPEAAILS